MLHAVIDVLHGFAFGLANIIPGVSGGTFALVLGFYERLLGFINRINPAELKELLSLKLVWMRKPTDRERWNVLHRQLSEKDWYWIMRLGAGALACIFLLSSLMDFLLEEHFEITYAFFFGLILLSIAVPWKLMKHKALPQYVALLAGIALTVGLAAAVNPYDKVEKKSEIYKVRYEQQVQSGEILPAKAEDVKFKYTGKYSPAEFGMIFVAGMIAVSAMILPGVSGSLMLILMGQYFVVIKAVSGLKTLMLDQFVFLGIFAVGMAFGILVTARIVEWALNKFHDSTMAFLTGLIVGSLYALWPFKEVRVLDVYLKDGGLIKLMEDSRVYTNINQLPSDMGLLLPALVCAVVGMAMMFFFMKKDPDIQGDG